VIEITARIGRNNRITLPAEVRRHLGVGLSDTIAFVFTERGTVEIYKPRFDLESIIGSVPAIPGASLDFEQEIEAATAEEAQRVMQCITQRRP
jgi:bifunctional DNA-binding transcriptional regulator/antitoxin component of YhaV-PrlF toxin-antitoxin module